MLFIFVLMKYDYQFYIDAIAVIPKHNTTFRGIHNMPSQMFLESGNKSGAATTL